MDWDDFKALTLLAFIILALLGILVGGCYLLERQSCFQQYRESGHMVDFGAFSGCRIKDGENWIPAANWRVM